MMSRLTSTFVAALVAIPLLMSDPVDAETTVVASWNIRNLGWDNGKDFEALGAVGSYFDFIAVQEVMSEVGVLDLKEALERETRVRWDHLCSDLIGRGTYREMYCFVWRDSKIDWVDGAVVYLDDSDVFAREPFSARFETADGFQFIATSIHSIYGENIEGREKEARALRDYRDWLVENFSPTPIFLMGDFNLAPTNPAWAPVGAVMYPLIQDKATTLSSHDGKFANLYDNIWVDAEQPLPISRFGRLEFPNHVLRISHEKARERVSDHIPVWVEIDTSISAKTFPPHVKPTASSHRTQQPAAMRRMSGPAIHPGGKESASAEPIIGNKNSNVYHLPGCGSYGKVSPRNQVIFTSETEAQARGFRRAGNC